MMPLIAIELYERFLEILLAPYYFRDMLWMIVPIILTTLLMELYFGRYKYEEMGWSSVFGNSLVLIFVSIDLVRHIYNLDGWQGLNVITPQTVLVVAVIFEGILLTLTGFYHLLPRGFAFELSSHLPINFIAYISVVLIYSGIPIVDFFTVLSSLALLIVFAIVIKLIQIFTPKAVDIEEIGKKKTKKLLR